MNQRPAGLGLHVRRVNDRQSAPCQSLAGNEVQHLEGILGGCLVVLIVADQSTAVIRRDYFARQEVLPRKRALARSAGTDQDDEGQLGDFDGHGASLRRYRQISSSGSGSTLTVGSAARSSSSGALDFSSWARSL